MKLLKNISGNVCENSLSEHRIVSKLADIPVLFFPTGVLRIKQKGSLRDEKVSSMKLNPGSDLPLATWSVILERVKNSYYHYCMWTLIISVNIYI